MVDKRLEESRVALQYLEMQLINTACDDPGATIGMSLSLPILQVGSAGTEYGNQNSDQSSNFRRQLSTAIDPGS